MSVIQIVEVGLRDGLQNEVREVSLKQRYQLVKKLSSSGLKRIELGSFVSSYSISQMECVPLLVKKVLLQQKKRLLPKNIIYSAFVPNQKGFDRAVECGLKEISFFVSCTNSFSQKNINRDISDSLKTLKSICKQAKNLKIKVRVYLSVAFYCPYEGKVKISQVVSLADRIIKAGAFEISISDTIGEAVYTEVLSLMQALKKKIQIQKIALHLHNTKGMALGNVIAGLESGVRVFDSSIGGLGGCPYAPGASGNIATEDLVYFLERVKYKTGIKLPQLMTITQLLEKSLKHSLPATLKKRV